MKNVNLLFSDTKEFLSDKVNRLTISVLFLSFMTVCGFFYLNAKVEKCIAKVHFRYFNLTRSLEDIYNVKIDTKDGTLKVNPSTIINTLDKQ